MSEIEINGMNSVPGIGKLQTCFLFKGLSFEETRMLARICKPVEKEDGEHIIDEDSIGRALFFIVSGKADVVQRKDDKEKVLTTLKSGDIFGEMSLIEDTLTSAGVVARSKVQLLKIDKKELDQIMDDNDKFAAKIYRSFCIVLSNRLRTSNKKLRELDKNG